MRTIVRYFPKWSASLLFFLFCSFPFFYSAQAQVAGTFTINSAQPTGGTNFQTFTQAINALAAGINANLLFKWRRDHLRAMRASSAASSSAVLVPVQVAPDMDSGSQLLPPASPATAVPASRSMRNAGVIELDIAGVQLRLRGPVDEASLCSVLRALRQTP